MSRNLHAELEHAKACRDMCLHGTGVPNGHKDLVDIFWLMGWADWEAEVQMIEAEIAHEHRRDT